MAETRTATHQTTDAARDVGTSVKHEGEKVASVAASEVKGLYREAKEELREQAQRQHERVADGLHTVSGELSDMVAVSSSEGIAAELVREASQRTESVAAWLDARDAGSLVTEVSRFARRRPGVFIALAAGVGVALGRATRAAVDTESETATPSADSVAAPPPVTQVPPVPPVPPAPPVAPQATSTSARADRSAPVTDTPIADAAWETSRP
jgi:hypothetical protein